MNHLICCIGISQLVIVKPVLYSNGLRLPLRSVFHSNRSFTFMSSSLHLRFAHRCRQQLRWLPKGRSWLIESCINLRVSCRIKVARGRGIYYPRGPFAADLQHLPLQRVQEIQWGQKDKLSRGERWYEIAVLAKSLFLLIIIFVKP